MPTTCNSSGTPEARVINKSGGALHSGWLYRAVFPTTTTPPAAAPPQPPQGDALQQQQLGQGARRMHTFSQAGFSPTTTAAPQPPQGDLPSQGGSRRKKTSSERRQQRARAEARVICHILRVFGELDTHRGCQVSSLGQALRSALVTRKGDPSTPHVPTVDFAPAPASAEGNLFNERKSDVAFVPVAQGGESTASHHTTAPLPLSPQDDCIDQDLAPASRVSEPSSEVVHSAVVAPFDQSQVDSSLVSFDEVAGSSSSVIPRVECIEPGVDRINWGKGQCAALNCYYWTHRSHWIRRPQDFVAQVHHCRSFFELHHLELLRRFDDLRVNGVRMADLHDDQALLDLSKGGR